MDPFIKKNKTFPVDSVEGLRGRLKSQVGRMLHWNSYPRALSLELSEASLLATILTMGCPWYLHRAPDTRMLFVLYSKNIEER